MCCGRDSLAQGPMCRRSSEASPNGSGSRTRSPAPAAPPAFTRRSTAPAWDPGDEVITSRFSFIASANVIAIEHATPVFAEIDEQSERRPGRDRGRHHPANKAIMPVHIFGYPCEIEAINGSPRTTGWRWSRTPARRSAAIDGRPWGRTATRRCSGSIPNKQLTTGEGGLITTDDDDAAWSSAAWSTRVAPSNGDWLRTPDRVQLPDGRDVRRRWVSRSSRSSTRCRPPAQRSLDRYRELLADRRG